MGAPVNPTQKRYPPELKGRGVRMVLDLRRPDPADTGVVARVARQLGVGVESLRTWVNQGEVDAGERPGLATKEHDELVQLPKEVKELRRTNEMAVRCRPWRHRRGGDAPPALAT